MKIPGRWIAVAFFVLSSALNYLDRQLLSALSPEIRAEFHWSLEDFGRVVSYFSLIYAAAAPLMGLVIDRIGLNRGVTLAVGGWSLATMAHAGIQGIGGLIGARLLLGVTQGGGIPAAGKAMSTYLQPPERALGNAFSQIGISVGLSVAPILANAMRPSFGWRGAFLFAGALGFLWLPVWWWIARRTPRQPVETGRKRVDLGSLLQLRTFWGLIGANMLAMTVYSLWTVWAVEFLTASRGVAPDVARGYSWIPFLIGGLGGLAGGMGSIRLHRMGLGLPQARRASVALGAAAALLSTALAPYVPSLPLAALCIGASFFFSSYLSVNLYALPLDLFGWERAAFGSASLTCAYGAMQAILSPWIGRMVEQSGNFNMVCLTCALLPMLGTAVLYATRES
jgi:ACS family hexuronate transporter-like MFS transporter